MTIQNSRKRHFPMRGERFTSRFGQSFWMPFKSLAQKNAVCASCGCSIYPHVCVVVLCIISQIIAPLLMAIPYKFILHNIWGGNVLPAAFTALTIFFLFFFALPAFLTTAISWKTETCSSVHKKTQAFCAKWIGKHGLVYLGALLILLGKHISDLL